MGAAAAGLTARARCHDASSSTRAGTETGESGHDRDHGDRAPHRAGPGGSGPLRGLQAGILVACEADANDLYAITSGRGLSASRLPDLRGDLSGRDRCDQGTPRVGWRPATCSCSRTPVTGDKVTDVSGDEADGLDETWVLYDRQLLDDELHALWAGFALGVRILVLSDSSAIADRWCETSSTPPRRRTSGRPRGSSSCPATFGWRRTMRTVPCTTGSSRSLGAGDREQVDATVLLISGCQDNQYSRDGDRNGLFTEQLRAVWDDGRFSGSHRDLFQAISQRMPPDQTPNYLPVGRIDREFEKATPFTV